MLEAEKVPSSMLFTGPEGAGKELAAVCFASRLNCVGAASCAESRCASCGKAARLEHPDLHLVYPLPSGPVEKSLPALMDSRREDFLASGEFGNKARSIGIDQVRKIIEEAAKHPFEGRRSALIVCEAHMATKEAQNAILKLLEEPPEPVVMILVTEHPDMLLGTIISRCREVRFDPLPEETVADFLSTFYSVEKKEAKRLASVAEGNIRRGLRFLDERFLGLKKDAGSMIRLVLEGKAKGLPAEAASAAGSYTREETGDLLAEMAAVLRRIIRHREGMLSPAEAGALEKELGRDAIEASGGRNLPEDMRKIEAASKVLRRNVDMELTLTQLLLDLAGKWY